MRDKNKYIEDFIESKLRSGSLKKTSDDFSKHLMQRIAAENKALAEERKSERIVKYVISSFSIFAIGFTVLLGVLSSTGKQSTGEGVEFSSIQTSNSLIEKLMYYVQSFFLDVLGFFGLSLSAGSINVMLIVILVVAVFILGERIFLRGRLKSGIQLK
jgi:hypothetical protein